MISIIIPIYNQADKLHKCLDSILAQTYRDYEVIIVDDGSSDDVQKIIKKYEGKLIVKCQKSKVNLGAPAARNRGFRESRGGYLFFCDADVVLASCALETMLMALKSHPEAGYAYSSFFWGRKLFKLGPFSEERLKQMPYINTMSLIRREAFPKGGWDESIKKFQDWDLYLTMLENGHKGFWLDKVLFKIKPGGTISSWLPSFTYKLLPFLPKVKKYKEALKIIKSKHHLL
ncbi:MAG: glycosyltransferase family A protein [Patescibacteria group bacterium]